MSKFKAHANNIALPKINSVSNSRHVSPNIKFPLLGSGKVDVPALKRDAEKILHGH